jgi:hypothetical protein
MYLLARSWGIQPSEFWAMTLNEWWCEYDSKAQQDTSKYAGRLTQGDIDDLKDWMDKKDGRT